MEKYLINPNHRMSKIHREIYGQFSEHLGRGIYEGLYVGENSAIPNVNGMRCDVVEALRELKIPVLRWPGGCFADEYHWQDGIGEKSTRKKMINTHWGGVVEDNSFGTHEFFELCSQLGCEAYVNGNVGSGSVREMSEWVEYMTFEGVSPMADLRKKNGREEPWKVGFFGVGNENWGCGGNMDAEYYADVYRRYQTYVRNYGKSRIYKIACGPNGDDCNWTDTLMKKAGRYMDGLSIHYYTWMNGKPALDFSDEDYYETIRRANFMDELLTRHSGIMDRYDPKKRVGLIVDEWGTWYAVEEGTNPGFLYQQSSMRDAIVAGLTLNYFNKHSDRVRMANIAQTINVLQAMILTDGERMLKTPTYHVFRMYTDHMENTLLGSYITTTESDKHVPMLIESASVNENGEIIATIVNTSLTEKAEVQCQIADFCVDDIHAEILNGDAHDHNTFDDGNAVASRDYTDFARTADGFTTVIPPCSVVKFVIA